MATFTDEGVPTVEVTRQQLQSAYIDYDVNAVVVSGNTYRRAIITKFMIMRHRLESVRMLVIGCEELVPADYPSLGAAPTIKDMVCASPGFSDWRGLLTLGTMELTPEYSEQTCPERGTYVLRVTRALPEDQPTYSWTQVVGRTGPTRHALVLDRATAFLQEVPAGMKYHAHETRHTVGSDTSYYELHDVASARIAHPRLGALYQVEDQEYDQGVIDVLAAFDMRWTAIANPSVIGARTLSQFTTRSPNTFARGPLGYVSLGRTSFIASDGTTDRTVKMPRGDPPDLVAMAMGKEGLNSVTQLMQEGVTPVTTVDVIRVSMMLGRRILAKETDYPCRVAGGVSPPQSLSRLQVLAPLNPTGGLVSKPIGLPGAVPVTPVNMVLPGATLNQRSVLTAAARVLAELRCNSRRTSILGLVPVSNTLVCKNIGGTNVYGFEGTFVGGLAGHLHERGELEDMVVTVAWIAPGETAIHLNPAVYGGVTNGALAVSAALSAAMPEDYVTWKLYAAQHGVDTSGHMVRLSVTARCQYTFFLYEVVYNLRTNNSVLTTAFATKGKGQGQWHTFTDYLWTLAYLRNSPRDTLQDDNAKITLAVLSDFAAGHYVYDVMGREAEVGSNEENAWARAGLQYTIKPIDMARPGVQIAKLGFTPERVKEEMECLAALLMQLLIR